MKPQQLKFLTSLLECHAPPGGEEPAQELFRNHLKKVCDELATDALGSVVAVRHRGGKVKVLLDCHADEIALLVRYIDDKGYLYVTPSGGWDAEILVGQRVRLSGRHGAIPGVVGKPAVHMQSPEQRDKKSELHCLWIDHGCPADRLADCFPLGTPVTLDVPFREWSDGRAVSKAFDNRAGMYAVAETLHRLSKKGDAACYGVSAVQEEIGLRGARAACYGVDPQVAIAIDVTHATDYPGVDKRKHGEVCLGKGPVICRGPHINKKVYARLVEVATSLEIPYQLEVEGAGTGTDLDVIGVSRRGVAGGLVSLPLRYMHSPCEMAHLEDLENLVALLVGFVESVKETDSWIPGEP